MVAVMQQAAAANLKMKFEVEQAPPRTVKRRTAVRQITLDKDGKERAVLRFETREVHLPAGYMVYFPAGHSLFIDNEADLSALNLDGRAPLVDMNSGEEMAPIDTLSPKQVVERNTRTKGR